jgi:hypothetical protein
MAQVNTWIAVTAKEIARLFAVQRKTKGRPKNLVKLRKVGFEGNHSGGKVTVKVGCCRAVTTIQYRGNKAKAAAPKSRKKET